MQNMLNKCEYRVFLAYELESWYKHWMCTLVITMEHDDIQPTGPTNIFGIYAGYNLRKLIMFTKSITYLTIPSPGWLGVSVVVKMTV